MGTNPTKRGAPRALIMTMTTLLLSMTMFAPAASAVDGVDVNPVVHDTQNTVDRVAGGGLDSLPHPLANGVRSTLATVYEMEPPCYGWHWHMIGGNHYHDYGNFPCEPWNNSPE